MCNLLYCFKILIFDIQLILHFQYFNKPNSKERSVHVGQISVQVYLSLTGVRLDRILMLLHLRMGRSVEDTAIISQVIRIDSFIPFVMYSFIVSSFPITISQQEEKFRLLSLKLLEFNLH